MINFFLLIKMEEFIDAEDVVVVLYQDYMKKISDQLLDPIVGSDSVNRVRQYVKDCFCKICVVYCILYTYTNDSDS